MRGCLIGCTRCFFKPQHKDFRQHGRAPWLLWRFVGGVALAVQIVGSSGNTLVRHPHPELPSCGRPKDRSSARRPIHSWPPLRRGLSCWNDPARPELSCCGSSSSANTRYTLYLLAPLRQLQKTHGGGALPYLPPEQHAKLRPRQCDRRHKLLFEYPIIFWTA